ncbi:hypothetical protein BKH41_05565 [Helicobacter sp. 12S02232-10]|uniref:hypothetical protein n=1 Tax=Helicobacter sp. 12S02232-10 TaxID=1476197 RepID=UPI000BA564CB|nr:hypothetical protein [Helicobacter sp. 12S02232-10]PAF48731.1 hypothetical protein BKH41_05565 [Helicobacter sp. 12S02232-10]
MYDIWFFIFFWVVAVLFALPIIAMGFVWVMLQKSPSPPKPITLKDIENLLAGIKNKGDLEGILEKFLKNFKIPPSDKADLKHWLDIVGKIASSEHFEIDYVAKFGQDLEEANEEIGQEIANTVGLALKNRKKVK